MILIKQDIWSPWPTLIHIYVNTDRWMDGWMDETDRQTDRYSLQV